MSESAKNQITGSEAVIKSLIAEGIEVIYGYPGGAIMPIYDALWHYMDKIKHILTRHEQGAVHAAEGWGRIKGKAAVCFATSGPGATNLITGIADAIMDSTPMVRQMPSFKMSTGEPDMPWAPPPMGQRSSSGSV